MAGSPPFGRNVTSGSGWRAFNLGTGAGTSKRDVIEAVARVTGKAVPHRFGPRRPGDPPVLVSDAACARAELGWVPQSSDIDTIVATAWAWHHGAHRG